MSMTDNNGFQNGRGPDGKWIRGNSGKPKGASKNKMRDEIKTFIGDNWANFGTWFETLKPREKIEVMMDLMPYAIPRLQSIAMVDSEGNDLQQPGAQVDYTKLSESALREIIAASTLNENEQ
jgi:hypothetical protein